MKLGPYEREVAFRSLDSKFCPGCGRRRYGLVCFCNDCEKKLTPGVVKALHNRQSFAWAYFEALRILSGIKVQ
ncbi:MAG TPA: hypothetical protein VL325_04535 [Pyrinomonadaceae bacterium]|jgi:hypothetical protein|nr:hypothetical protein [Pyrinomonadaceae bacterium]